MNDEMSEYFELLPKKSTPISNKTQNDPHRFVELFVQFKSVRKFKFPIQFFILHYFFTAGICAYFRLLCTVLLLASCAHVAHYGCFR